MKLHRIIMCFSIFRLLFLQH